MHHRTGATAQIQHSSQGSGKVSFGSADGFDKAEAFGQIGGDGTGQGTARAVGIGIVDAPSLQPDHLSPTV